jgi:hypothetical protein
LTPMRQAGAIAASSRHARRHWIGKSMGETPSLGSGRRWQVDAGG